MRAPDGLCEAAALHMGAPVGGGARVEGGYEADVYRVTSEGRALALHVSPSWRSAGEVRWAHDVARAASRSVDVVVVPVEGTSGTTFEWEGRVAALFPFVSGRLLDRNSVRERRSAAHTLAAIHRALLHHDPGPCPDPRASPRGRSDIPELSDPALDRWWERRREAGVVEGVTHGDYYPGNLLCDVGRVVGVIDWHEAAVRPYALELAGAVFEMCRRDDHTLDPGTASDFVAAYRAAGGVVPDSELDELPRFMSWWVREDARGSLSLAPGPDNVYGRMQVEAFRRLRASEGA